MAAASGVRQSRTPKKTRISCPKSNEKPQDCVICLDRVSCRGKLGVCQHWFCFKCILEWSKNTNTCPVCKKTFRCISKIHLIPGKSPLQKVRVKDVDQRGYQNDEEFIWAELDSSSEGQFSDYSPSSHEDPEDTTFYPLQSSKRRTNIDSDGSGMNEPSVSSDNDSDVHVNMSCDEDSSLDSDSSPNIQRNSSSRAILSEDEELSDNDSESTHDKWLSSDADMFWSSDDTEWKSFNEQKWLSSDDDTGQSSDNSSESDMETEGELRQSDKTRKSKKKSKKSNVMNGFHRIRKKHQRSSSKKFEAERQRKRSSPQSSTKKKNKKTNSNKNINSKENDPKKRSSTIGQWMSKNNGCSQSKHSQPTTSRSSSTRSQDSNRQQGTRSRSGLRSEENPARIEISYNSTRNDFGQTQNVSVSQQSTFARKRRKKKSKLTITLESDSESCSSGESWSLNNFVVPRVLTRGNRRTSSRSSRILKEVQNFGDS